MKFSSPFEHSFIPEKAILVLWSTNVVGKASCNDAHTKCLTLIVVGMLQICCHGRNTWHIDGNSEAYNHLYVALKVNLGIYQEAMKDYPFEKITAMGTR